MDEVIGIRLGVGGGVVSAGELADAGVSEQTLRTAVRRGELQRVRRGAYVDARRHREAAAQEQYRLRGAAVLRTRPLDAASHHAAHAVHRLPLVGCDLGVLDTVGPVRATIARRGLVVRPAADIPTMAVDGIATVPVAEAVVQVGCGSGVTAAVVAGDAALHRGRCTVQGLHDAIDRVGILRHRAALDRLAGLLDPGAESPGESVTRVMLRTAGLPVRSQVRIADPPGASSRGSTCSSPTRWSSSSTAR